MKSINLTEEEFKALQYAIEDITEVYQNDGDDEEQGYGDKLLELFKREMKPQIKAMERDIEYDVECREIADKAYLMCQDKYTDMSSCGTWAIESMPETQSDMVEEMCKVVYDGKDLDEVMEDEEDREHSGGLFDAFNFLLIRGLR